MQAGTPPLFLVVGCSVGFCLCSCPVGACSVLWKQVQGWVCSAMLPASYTLHRSLHRILCIECHGASCAMTSSLPVHYSIGLWTLQQCVSVSPAGPEQGLRGPSQLLPCPDSFTLPSVCQLHARNTACWCTCMPRPHQMHTPLHSGHCAPRHCMMHDVQPDRAAARPGSEHRQASCRVSGASRSCVAHGPFPAPR